MRVALLAVALVVGCGGGDTDRPVERSHDVFDGPERVPWDPGDGPTTALTGRVVTPAGAPIAGARVELVYPGDPHWPPSVAGQETTDAAGRFRFDDLSVHAGFSIVVRHDGSARTFDPRPDREVEVRFAPTRAVTVQLECRAPLRDGPDPYGDGAPAIELSVRWLPGDDLIAFVTLPATDGTPLVLGGRGESPEERVMPGRVQVLPRVPADARHFERQLQLPDGPHHLFVQGPCGVLEREIDVSEEHDAFTLTGPAEGAASLTLRLASDSAREEVHPSVRLHGVALQTPYRLTRREPIRFTRLPPGDYAIDGVTCHEPVNVRPSGATTVTIGPGRCDVTFTGPGEGP